MTKKARRHLATVVKESNTNESPHVREYAKGLLAEIESGGTAEERNVKSAEAAADLVKAFINENGLDAVVCIAAALRRGILDAAEADRWERPTANTGEPWVLSGLGQWVDALQTADRAVTFGT